MFLSAWRAESRWPSWAHPASPSPRLPRPELSVAALTIPRLKRRLVKGRRHHLAAHSRKIAVIGLGYVGLPVAVAFARSGVPVIGFDIDRKRVDELRAGNDRTREVEPSDLAQKSLRYEYDPARLERCGLLHRHRADADRRGQPARPRRHAGGLRHRGGGAQARRHRRLRIDSLSRCGRGRLRAGAGEAHPA